MDGFGLDKIRAHEVRLLNRFVDGLRGLEGVTLYYADDLADHLSTVSVNVKGLEAMDTGIMLDVDYNIATRTGLHCAPKVHEQMGTLDIHGTVRFSIGVFNTEEHVDTAIEALREIAQAAKKRKK